MREINVSEITEAVKNMCIDANYALSEDMKKALESAQKEEVSELGKQIFSQLEENLEIAASDQIPICQDTGMAVFFFKIGQDVHFTGGNLGDAINEGVRQGYTEGYLRKSVVGDPLIRVNTKDNTPANIYCDFVEGDKIEITILTKGGGSENASFLKMLTPLDGWEGIKKFVIESIKLKGANACPPIIVGLGIGGDFASVGLLAKKALLRTIGSKNIKQDYNDKEQELLKEINKLNIGPMGLGGKPTALAVFIETKPCHIASMPVAINVQCHSCRRKTIII